MPSRLSLPALARKPLFTLSPASPTYTDASSDTSSTPGLMSASLRNRGGSSTSSGGRSISEGGLPRLPYISPVKGMRRNRRQLRQCYEMGRVLGVGGSSVVRAAEDLVTGEEWACKILMYRNAFERNAIMDELRILAQLNHDNVMAGREYFEEDGKIFLIVELMRGPAMLEALWERGSFTEDDCRTVARQLLEAVSHMHRVGVAHRDLKLENIMLRSECDCTSLCIVDFGLAKQLTRSKPYFTDSCGTLSYVAPEVLRKGSRFGTAIDVWSAGVIMFMLLSGAPAFADTDLAELSRRVARGWYSFRDPAWDLVSTEAIDFVSALLTRDPEQRPSAAEALNHPWLR